MSPMAFPLMSNLVSEELLPSAFKTMVRSLFSLESARDREVRGCGGGGGIEGEGCVHVGGGEKEKAFDRVYIIRIRGKMQSYFDCYIWFVTVLWESRTVFSLSATCRVHFSVFGITSKPLKGALLALVVYHCQL